MNGIHDLGGMDGFGEVVQVENEPNFYKEWEKTAFAILFGLSSKGVIRNLDEFRHGFERMNPAHHIISPYYAKWLSSSETLLVERGILDAEELESRTKTFLENPDTKIPRKENPELWKNVKELIRTGASTVRQVSSSPRFKVGDKVKTKNLHPKGHTRLARYVRDKYGTINKVYDAHVFPDASAHGKGDCPQYLYSVTFDAGELWGTEDNDSVNIDLWESYLEPR